MRRRKDDRRVDLASRGTMQRWRRISSRVRPQGCPESLGGASLVKPLGVKPGQHLRYTSAEIR